MSVDTQKKSHFHIHPLNPRGDIVIQVYRVEPTGLLPEGVEEYIASGKPFYKLILRDEDLSDYSFLLRQKDRIKRLGLHCLNADWATIGQLIRLQCLDIGQLTANCTLDFSALSDLKFLSLHWHKSYAGQVHSMSQLKWLHIFGIGLDNMESIYSLPSLERLDLNYSRKLQSLKGIEQFSKLVILKMESNSQLQDIQDVSNCQALEAMRLVNNKRLYDYSRLRHLQKLQELTLVGAETDSVSWMANLPLLYDLAMDIKLADNNLDFLYELKNLQYARFRDKRGQSVKEKDVQAYLEQKGFNQKKLAREGVGSAWQSAFKAEINGS